MRLKYFLLIISLSLFPLGGYSADIPVMAWLNKMSNAGRSLNYMGTFIYHHDDMIDTMRVVHKVDRNGERERLYSLDGSGREVLRDGNYVTCILPDNKAVMVDKSRPKRTFTAAFPDNFDKLARNYEFILDGNARIAERPSRIVVIKPKDSYRYGYRLWLDNTTGLLLKSEKLDENGGSIERIVFTDIKIDVPIEDSELKPGISGKEYKWHHSDKGSDTSVKNKSSWHIGALPPGFELMSHKRIAESNKKTEMNHIVVTDGLAWASVYIEDVAKDKDLLVGEAHMGAVNAYGRVMNNYHVTVVGEVPATTVHMIGDSLQRR
jgi:sigma-E factor negative regulatory protein RseB